MFKPTFASSSPRHRFAISLCSNILGGASALLASLVIARGLGPSQFGDFNFLLGSFTTVNTLINMGTAMAFYTFISRRHRSRFFFRSFFLWTVLQLAFLCGVLAVLPPSVRQKFWFEHPIDQILLALVTSFITLQFWPLAQQIGESLRDTFGAQIRYMVISLVYLVCAGTLFLSEHLNLYNLFAVTILVYGSVGVFYTRTLLRSYPFATEERESFSILLKEFYVYCAPFFGVNIVNLICAFLDLWLLKKFGGSVEQGYFSLGIRCSAVVLVLAKSVNQILWKEMAEAHARGDYKRLRSVYEKVFSSLLFLSCAISGFAIAFTPEFVSMVLGPSYKNAVFPLQILFLYPILQVLVTVNQAVLLSLGKTATNSRIDMAFLIISLFAVYFLIGPKDAAVAGLQLGSIGLAYKMVGCCLFQALLNGYFAAQSVGAKFQWGRQILGLFLAFELGTLLKKGVLLLGEEIGGGAPSGYVLVLVTVVLYFALLFALAAKSPSLVGLSQEEYQAVLAKLRSRARRPLINWRG